MSGRSQIRLSLCWRCALGWDWLRWGWAEHEIDWGDRAAVRLINLGLDNCYLRSWSFACAPGLIRICCL